MAPSTRRVVAASFVVAVVATAGSLYYSLGMGLYPCELCWYQRILMYPLVVVLGYAALAGWPDVHRVVLPLSVPGLGVALYHSYLQLSPGATCSVWGCNEVHLRLVGLSIPNQSALAFTLVTVGMAWLWREYRRNSASLRE